MGKTWLWRLTASLSTPPVFWNTMWTNFLLDWRSRFFFVKLMTFLDLEKRFLISLFLYFRKVFKYLIWVVEGEGQKIFIFQDANESSSGADGNVPEVIKQRSTILWLSSCLVMVRGQRYVRYLEIDICTCTVQQLLYFLYFLLYQQDFSLSLQTHSF